jgi:tellurite resistance protein
MAAQSIGVTALVGHTLWAITALVWVCVLVNYVLRAHNHGGGVIADLRHPIQGPFAALAATVGMLLGAHYSVDFPTAGRVVAVLCTAIALVFGAWFVVQFTQGPRDIDHLHAGYLLPTVAAAFIAGQSAGTFGWSTLSVAAIGVGLLFWGLIGTLILGRMAFRAPLPSALLPTFAIFSAPPAVAGNAWFAYNGQLDTMQEVLLGTCVLLIAVQVVMLGAYRRLPFTLGFWAFTFTAASSGTYALHWLALSDAPGQQIWGWIVLVLVSLIVGGIAVRSVVYLVRAHTRSLIPN